MIARVTRGHCVFKIIGRTAIIGRISIKLNGSKAGIKGS
jgi:hypothetical protein